MSYKWPTPKPANAWPMPKRKRPPSPAELHGHLLGRSCAGAGFDAAAGVGRTAVYNHFSDKEALLMGFITFETERYVETLKRSLEGVEDPLQQLRTYVQAQARLKRVFHLAPGPDLRTVLSRGTQQRLRSPLAMAVTLQMLRRGRHLPLEQCFALELHLDRQWFARAT